MTINGSARTKTESSTRLGRIAVVFAATWFVVHVSLYVARIGHIDSAVFKATRLALGEFFAWQMGAFVLLATAAAILRPAAIGRVCGGFLLLGTLALLARSHDFGTVAKFLLLVLWLVAASNGLRAAIARFVGKRYATWGVAAAAVYAALVPACFLLGILHLLSPPVVAIAAIATALPGMILEVRRQLPFPFGRRTEGEGGVTKRPRNRLVDQTALTLTLSQRERGPICIPVLRRLDRMGLVDVFLMQTIWIILAISFVFAATSEMLSDAARVHLPYIHQVAADHGLSHQYLCWHRLQVMGQQTCCAAFACLGSDAAAKWFSWLAVPALVLLLSEEVFRRSRSARLALFAGAAVLGCPILLWVAGSLYVDHVVTLLCSAGFVVLFRALRTPCLRGIMLSAAMMSSLAQVKYTGLVFCVVWGGWLGLSLLRKCNFHAALRRSAAAGALLIVAASPWYVYVYAGTGNPFFPYLHGWFPSPHWVDGLTVRDLFEVHFKLSPGIGGFLEFPWIATYDTHRFLEARNGFLGYWPLALAPCLFLARPSSAPRYWDMALVGAAMIGGILVYTPYVRYWLPAYPLLTASCALAAGALTHGERWGRGNDPRSQAVWATALTALLLLPVTFISLNLPWNEYTGKISADKRLSLRFPGYPAVKQLNKILKPDDGVLCTGFPGVYLVGGRPYEYSLPGNDRLRIDGVASFAGFCRRHNIRYWIVNNALAASNWKKHEIAAEYWVEERLVTECDTARIYDVSERPSRFWNRALRRRWPPALETTEKPWNVFDASDDWVSAQTDSPARRADGGIVLAGKAVIRHRIQPEFENGLCRVKLDFLSDATTRPSLEFVWHDADGKALSREQGSAEGKSDYEARFYSTIPPGAKIGWVSLRERDGAPLIIKAGSVDCRPPLVSSDDDR